MMAVTVDDMTVGWLTFKVGLVWGESILIVTECVLVIFTVFYFLFWHSMERKQNPLKLLDDR